MLSLSSHFAAQQLRFVQNSFSRRSLASFVDAVPNRTEFLRGTKMAVTALKSNWRKISGDYNDVSSVVTGLMEDADPELCVKLLKTPSLKNYSGVRPRLEKASKEWLSEFLNLGGVDCLLDGLTSLSSGKGPKFTEALEQIECVRCIKAVLNSMVGLEVMTANNEFTRSLVQGKRVETYSSRPWVLFTDSFENFTAVQIIFMGDKRALKVHRILTRLKHFIAFKKVKCASEC